jgi:hypothetical protein
MEILSFPEPYKHGIGIWMQLNVITLFDVDFRRVFINSQDAEL